MSLNDKIVEIYEKWGFLSTEEVRRILKEHYGIEKSKRTVERHVVKQLVNKEGILVPDKPQGRTQTYSLARKSPAQKDDKKIFSSAKAGIGFFEWLRHRDERKRRKELELRAQIDARMEVITSGEKFTWAKFVEALHKHRKRYGLE